MAMTAIKLSILGLGSTSTHCFSVCVFSNTICECLHVLTMIQNDKDLYTTVVKSDMSAAITACLGVGAAPASVAACMALMLVSFPYHPSVTVSQRVAVGLLLQLHLHLLD